VARGTATVGGQLLQLAQLLIGIVQFLFTRETSWYSLVLDRSFASICSNWVVATIALLASIRSDQHQRTQEAARSKMARFTGSRPAQLFQRL